MGYNKYMTVLAKQRGNEPVPFSKLEFDSVSPNNFSDSNWEFRLDKLNYFQSCGCRDVWIMHQYNTLYTILTQKHAKYLLGVRMFGHMHSAVAEILLKSDKGTERVASLIKDVFGVSCKISVGIAPRNAPASKFPAKATFLYLSDKTGKMVQVNRLGYITLFLRSEENNKSVSATKLSAVFALLREPTVIKKILSGHITDTRSLATEFVKLAVKRGTDKDFSFFSPTAEEGNFLSKVWDALHGAQKITFNSDGSDYASMLVLAVYIWAQYNRLFDDTPSMLGPVMRTLNLNAGDFKKFGEFIANKSLMKKMGDRITQETSHHLGSNFVTALRKASRTWVNG